MATVTDYVNGENIDPVTGKSIKSVTTGTSGNPSDLTTPIQSSNGSYQAPGFGSLVDQTMDYYPDAVQSSGGAPATNMDNVQAKGGRSSDPVGDAKAAGTVSKFSDFLKTALLASTLASPFGPFKVAAGMASGEIDPTDNYGNYNTQPGWNDQYDAGVADAKKKGLTDPYQIAQHAIDYAKGSLPDPSSIDTKDNNANTSTGNDDSDVSETGDGGVKVGNDTYHITDNPSGYDGGTKGPTSDGNDHGAGGKDVSGADGTGGSDGGTGGTKGFDGGGGGDDNSGHGSDSKGGGGSTGGGSSGGGQAGRAGFETGGVVIRDAPGGSTVQQDKARDSMSSEATYMMPKSATSFHRGGPVMKQHQSARPMPAKQQARPQASLKDQAMHMLDGGRRYAEGGMVTQAGYEDGGTVIPQAPVGPNKMAPRPANMPAAGSDAGPLAEAPGDPGDQPGAPPGAPDDGRFNPTPAQVADDGITDNQPINADEGEYVTNKQSVAILGIDFMNWINDPQNAAELADVLGALGSISGSQNGGGAGGGMPPSGGAGAPPAAAAPTGPGASADLSAMSMGPGASAPPPSLTGGPSAPPPFMKKKPALPPAAA